MNGFIKKLGEIAGTTIALAIIIYFLLSARFVTIDMFNAKLDKQQATLEKIDDRLKRIEYKQQ